MVKLVIFVIIYFVFGLLHALWVNPDGIHLERAIIVSFLWPIIWFEFIMMVPMHIFTKTIMKITDIITKTVKKQDE